MVTHRRCADLVRHALETLVEPGGRVLVSHYQGEAGTDLTSAEHLRELGFDVAGSSRAPGTNSDATAAWLDA